MALSSSLSYHHHNHTLNYFPHRIQYSKPPPARKLLSYRTKSQLIHPSSSDVDYKASWAAELAKRHGPLSAESLKDDDGPFFRSAVDRRAVENVRMLVVDAVQHARAGHPGMALGMAEAGYVLYRHAMRYNPDNPGWFNRDRRGTRLLAPVRVLAPRRL